MTRHAMFDSKYPPAPGLFEPDETTSEICLQLCHSWGSAMIISGLEDDDIPVSVFEEVRDEYARLVPEASEDAKRIDALRGALAERDLSFSFDEGYDKGEAAEDGADLAREEGHKGYAYCTMQDVDCVIHTGLIYFGFSSLDNSGDESDAEIGQAVVEALEEVGFTPDWNGKQTGRITCEGLKFELPLAD
ncbi:hypothetical protein D8M31_09375 [Corynebacterium genitalium]|nr:hypothetical protein D8M31_09375 [Corynebacterium genitalium]